jgi:hypothetical protein
MLWRLRRRDVFWGWTGVVRELWRGVLLGFSRGSILNDLRGLWRRHLLDHGRGDCTDDLPRLWSWVVLGDSWCCGFVNLLGLPLGILRSNDGRHELHELPRGPIRRRCGRGLCELRSGHVPDELHFGHLHSLCSRNVQPRYGSVVVLRVRGGIVLREHGAPCIYIVLFLRGGQLPDKCMLDQRQHSVRVLPRR